MRVNLFCGKTLKYYSHPETGRVPPSRTRVDWLARYGFLPWFSARLIIRLSLGTPESFGSRLLLGYCRRVGIPGRTGGPDRVQSPVRVVGVMATVLENGPSGRTLRSGGCRGTPDGSPGSA